MMEGLEGVGDLSLRTFIILFNSLCTIKIQHFMHFFPECSAILPYINIGVCVCIYIYDTLISNINNIFESKSILLIPTILGILYNPNIYQIS